MIGKMLGHYQITTQLGAGGMGEVYRARDSKLERDVAIKVLPRSFAADQERLARFEQEAKTLASLNHPGIMVIHDSGIHEGAPYLISELLEGQTLRDVLGNGPLSPRKAAEYAVQIAHALAAAHNKGIIHRDLKPENLFSTQDDRVKVLDFGLAKLRHATKTDAPASARPTIINATEPGMLLGTPGYMAPEQARGGEAEARSDIFALGAILYEMLCGQRAFAGETSVESMHAILTTEPQDLFERVERLPPALERVVRRCLEKRPEQRFQSAADLAFALENSISSGGSVLAREPVAAPRSLSAGRLLPWAIAMIALVAATYAMLVARSAAPGVAVTPTRPAAPLRKIQLTLPLDARGLAISPDGRKLVYVHAEGLWLLWLDRVAPPVLLAARRSVQNLNAVIQQPFWSPQSSDVGFFDGTELRRVSVNGGSARSIATTIETRPGTAGGAWFADDRILFTTGTAGLYEVPAGGGKPTLALAPGDDEQSFYHASALPGGRGVLFVVHRRSGVPPWDTIAVWSPPAGRKILLQTPGIAVGGPRYAPSGQILFSRTDNTVAIWAFPFSLETLERTGEAFLVVDEASNPSIANDGSLAYILPSATQLPLRQLVWVDRSGKVAGTIGAPMRALRGAQLSGDGQRIVAVAGAGTGSNSADIWVFDVAGGNAVPLTRTPEAESDCFWYPDGRTVLYAAPKGKAVGGWTTREKLVDGFAEEKEVLPGWVRSFSHDGKYVFVRMVGVDLPGSSPEIARSFVWAYADLSPGSDRKLKLLPGGFDPTDIALSPDDHLMAYASTETGRLEVFLLSFPDFGNKKRVSREGGMRMQWRPDGSELFWLTDQRALWSASIKQEGGLQIGEPTKACDLPESIIDLLDQTRTRFQVASDGQRFLMVQTVSAPKDAAAESEQPKSNGVLIENWFEEFREKK